MRDRRSSLGEQVQRMHPSYARLRDRAVFAFSLPHPYTATRPLSIISICWRERTKTGRFGRNRKKQTTAVSALEAIAFACGHEALMALSVPRGHTHSLYCRPGTAPL